MNNNKNILPTSWSETSFAEITLYIQRGKSPKYVEHSELPVINQKCIRWNGIQKEHLKYIHPNQIEKWTPERYLQDGDILWNSTGTGTIGRACLYNEKLFKQVVVDSHVTIVRTYKNHVISQYVFYFIMSPSIQKEIEKMQSGSTNQVELGKTVISNTRVPIAPLNEQKRIVDKIEKLFSDLDAAEANLKKVQNLIKTYRQSVLKAAVTGELTKEWREQNKDKLEHGQKALQRILKSRHEQWKRTGKYEEPKTPDTSNLPELPEGWVWCSLDQFSLFITSGSRGWAKYYSDKGTLFLRSQNITQDGLALDNLAYVNPPKGAEGDRTKLSFDDLLISITGYPGNIARYNQEYEAYISQHVCLVRLVEPALAEYIEIIARSEPVQNYFKDVQYGLTKPGLNLTQVSECPIPITCLLEQNEIIRIISDTFLKIEEVEKNNLRALSHCSFLRQSILKSAFSGKLVPQCTNDEPASELLKRIQTENTPMNEQPKHQRKSSAMKQKINKLKQSSKKISLKN